MSLRIHGIQTEMPRCVSTIMITNHGVIKCQKISGHKDDHGDVGDFGYRWENLVDREDPRVTELIAELAARPSKMPRPSAMCHCEHDILEHNMVKSHNGCDVIGCTCRQYRRRPTQETP